MRVAAVVREHRAGVQRKQRRLVFAQIHVQLRELLPGDELARCTVDRLPRELECPLEFALGPEEVALRVKEGVRLRVLLHGVRHDLYRLDLLVCDRISKA